MMINDVLAYTGAIVFVVGAVAFAVLNLLKKRRFNRHQYNRKKSIQVLRKIRSFSFAGQRLNYLRKIDPFVFEELLLDAFEAKGFKVARNTRYSGDQGIDGIVWKDGMKFLIQAKRYKGYVSHKHLTEFISLVERENCWGYFCHTGKTGKGTRTAGFIYSNVKIVSGKMLIELIDSIDNQT